MLLKSWAVKRLGTGPSIRMRKHGGSTEAVAAAVCEFLEHRRLLTTYTWTVPTATPAHTAAYIEAVEGSPGLIQIRLNSETAPPLDPNPFTNTTGLSLVQAPTGSSGFLFVDKVPAHLKPNIDFSAPGDPYGIKVDGGTDATLRVEADTADSYIVVGGTTTTNTEVIVTGFGGADGHSYVGTGLEYLTVRTNDVDASGNWPNGGTDVFVNGLHAGVHLTVDTGDGTYDRVTLGPSAIGQPVNVFTGAGDCTVTVSGPSGGDFNRALVDFGDGTGEGNNQLSVESLGEVTLDQEPGTANHVIVVEDVNVDGSTLTKPGILYVADEAAIDDLLVEDYGRAYVRNTADGTEVPAFEVHVNGLAFIEGQTAIGTLTNEGEVTFTYDAGETLPPTTVDQFKIGPTTTLTNSNGNVIVDVDADVTILAPTEASSPSKIGDLRVNELALLKLAEHPTNEASRLLGVGKIVVEKSAQAPMAVLDVTNNAMFIDYSSSSPVTDVQALITSGYAAGNWDGFGINSSTAANETNTGIGYGEATDLFSSFPASWEGQSLDNSTVLVKYTFYGDANLNGFVNLQDFNLLAANFGGTGKRWTQGNFNYDINGAVNLQDFNLLAANFGAGTTSATQDDYTTGELEDMLPD